MFISYQCFPISNPFLNTILKIPYLGLPLIQNKMNYTSSYQEEHVASRKTFLNDVFGWMGIGLAITSVISYFVAKTPSLMGVFVNGMGTLTLPGYIVMFGPIGFVLLMSFAYQRLSYGALVGLFATYAAIMGVSLSFIFLIYTDESIYATFGTSALMFGTMAAIGYVTKTDLTKLGNILLMALVGIVIASLVNMFLHSETMSYVISFISVIVFCGLTAYDVQKLKNLGEEVGMDQVMKSKLGILGALTLYLDFINLFLSLLRLFGNRRGDY